MMSELTHAVEIINLDEVTALVNIGADTNAFRSGQPEGDQPDTPLKMVVFRLSDCLINDTQRESLADIARVLLKHGADPTPAFHYAETRYGTFTSACDVWSGLSVIAHAYEEKMRTLTKLQSSID